MHQLFVLLGLCLPIWRSVSPNVWRNHGRGKGSERRGRSQRARHGRQHRHQRVAHDAPAAGAASLTLSLFLSRNSEVIVA